MLFGLGSGTFIKLVVKEDGGPNWFGIITLSLMFIVVFIWRCCEFVPEYWVAIRRRFNRVVRNKDGTPREYDPLKLRPGKAGEKGKKVRSFRFRIYLFHSLVLVNCGERETNLGIDAITLGEAERNTDMDFDTSMSVAWKVSTDPGNPTKSFLRPAASKWWHRGEKDELQQLVQSYSADGVLRAYEAISAALTTRPSQLPLLDFETDPWLKKARALLLDKYGVEVTGLLYGRRSVSPAVRWLQGQRLIAKANRAIARAIRGTKPEPVPEELAGAAAAATTTGHPHLEAVQDKISAS